LESPEVDLEDEVKNVARNVRVIPIAAGNEAPLPTSSEAAPQLSLQMERLVSEAKQEIQSSIR
jgi:hypothetical protein